MIAKVIFCRIRLGVMKSNTLLNALLWIALSLVGFTGCTSMPGPNTDIIATPSPPSVTQKPFTTETITRVPSLTSLASRSTLTATEQENYVSELLKTNAGCKLPCWWGITPGETSWEDAEHFLIYLGATIGRTDIPSGMILHWAKFSDSLSDIETSFFEQEIRVGIIDSISAIGNYGSTQNQRDFESLWESYSPKEVIKAYGVPSRVLLSATGVTGVGDTGNNGYILWIFYDHLGFLIRYGGIVPDLPIYHFCPELQVGADDIYRIDFYLQHPDNSLPLESHDTILTTSPSRAMSIQDAAGMSTEEFYRLFIQGEEPTCFDTPHDIWPVR